MYCRYCGAEIDDNAEICPKCGCAMNAPAGLPPATIANNMGLAIFSLICCCMPLGIVSLIHSCKVADLERSGRIEEAQKAADDAKKFAWMAIILGIIANILYFVLEGASMLAELSEIMPGNL